MLAAMASSKRNHNVEDGIMNGGAPKPIEMVVLVWLIGLIVGEMQQVRIHMLTVDLSRTMNFYLICMSFMYVCSTLPHSVAAATSTPRNGCRLEYSECS